MIDFPGKMIWWQKCKFRNTVSLTRCWKTYLKGLSCPAFHESRGSNCFSMTISLRKLDSSLRLRDGVSLQGEAGLGTILEEYLLLNKNSICLLPIKKILCSLISGSLFHIAIHNPSVALLHLPLWEGKLVQRPTLWQPLLLCLESF